jgi:hypothetical protein
LEGTYIMQISGHKNVAIWLSNQKVTYLLYDKGEKCSLGINQQPLTH